MGCYRDPNHEVPAGARFCVSCGIPLQQRCPYGGNHWLAVADDRGHSLRACPECGKLLRSCAVCRRHYRLSDETCVTATCRGATLPPPRCDWPTAGGGPARRGSARIPRDCDLNQGSYRSWSRALKAESGSAISAYGNLYVVAGSTLYIADPEAPETEWKRVELHSALCSAPGALHAGGGFLFALTRAGAVVLTADNLNLIAQAEGQFHAQTIAGDQWQLYGTAAADSSPRIYCSPVKNPGSGARTYAPSDGQTLKGPPVVCQDGVYWRGPGSEIFCLRQEGMRHLCNVPGAPVALVAGALGSDPAGVFMLSRDRDQRHRLHFLNHSHPAEISSTSADGALVVNRLWSAGPYVFLARDAAEGLPEHGAAMLRFDPARLGLPPAILPWPRGMQLLDALLLEGPAGLYVELALRDPANNTVSFTRQAWDVQAPAVLSRAIGLCQVSLLVHDQWVVATGSQVLDGDRQFVLRGHRLWAAPSG